MTRWKKIVPAVAVAVALITGTALAAENFNTGETTHSQAATEAAVSGGAVASGPAAGGDAPQGTPPSGQKPDGTPPAGGPDGQSGQGGAPGGAPGGQSSSGVSSYDSVKSITSDTTLSDTTVSSTGKDENAIHVSGGAKANLNNVTVTRNSSNSTGGDNSSFYGVGAAILTTEGTTTINGGKITTDAAGGAGVFSYGTGVTYVSNTTISTKQDTSGGIHVAGGGTLYAWALNVATNGQSAAAIRSDRGGGKMVVNGGTYTSNGVGSPAIYSTADIAVNKATLTANSSEAICIEGLNSIHLYDTALTGNMGDDSQNDCTWNVILYQSMSGDSEVGNSTFEMNGGSLTAKNGGMFYTTNTESTITLSNVKITPSADNDFFLRCTGNKNQRGWGTTGSNGADCLFTGISQTMTGDVVWDSVSKLDFYMTDGSTLTGAVKDDESCAGSGGSGYCNLYISKDSKWVVTGDSTLTKLASAGTIVDKSGKTVTVKGTDGTVYVQGTSDMTVTVGSYSTTVDLSGASKTTSFSKYEVSQPTVSTTTSTTTGTSSTGTNKTTTSSKVTVKKSAIKKAVRSKNNKKIKFTLKKVSGVKGYQIKYSSSKKFTKKTTKTVKVKKTTKTVTKLKKKKAYYAKVRAYKTVNGKTYYSKWSTVKKVKVRK